MKVSIADRKVSEQLRAIADQLDKQIEGIAGQKMSFSLVVFNAEPGSRLNYISNCDRAYVAAAMTALVESWKKGMPDIPAHMTQ